MEENKEVTETQVEEQQPEKLSVRDALEVAIEAHSTPEVKAEPVKEEAAPEPEKPKEYDGPAEYNKEEREAWEKITPEMREANWRLVKSQRSRFTELQEATAKYKHIEELAKTIEPYIKAQGFNDSPAVAMQKAVAMYNEFQNGDPKAAARDYLRAKGIDPKALLEEEEKSAPNPEIIALRKEQEEIKQRLIQEDQAKIGAVLRQTWSEFESVTNGAGQPRFADIVGTDEKAIRLAGQIGSLVGGQTELSKQFIANAQALDPELTHAKLLERAYLYCGGQINDAPAPKTENPQKHLQRSNRAASSVPGRGSSGLATSTVKRFKTTREAAEHALAELNGK